MLPPPVARQSRGAGTGAARLAGIGAGAAPALARVRSSLGAGRGRLVAVVVAVLAVLVAVGVTVASPSSNVAPLAKSPAPETTPSAAAVPPSTPRARPSGPQAIPLTEPSSAPAPSTEAAPRAGSGDGEPSRSDMEQFVRSYYALLPGDTDKAWTMLGDKARSESSGSSSFSRFYGSIRKVSFAEGPTAVDDKTVQASLMFETKDGRTSGPERYSFVVQPNDDGDLQISSFSR